MANKKILPHIAMSIYEDELDFISPDDVASRHARKEASRIASEIDICYNEYNVAKRIASEVDLCYTQYAEEEAERIEEETEICYLEYDEQLFHQLCLYLYEYYQQSASTVNSCDSEYDAWITRELTICWSYLYSHFYQMSGKCGVIECYEQFAQKVDLCYMDYYELLAQEEAEAKAIQEISKSQRTAAYRRKQEYRHKEKLRRNAIEAARNFDQRIREDMNNKSNRDWRNAIIAMSNSESLYKYMNKLARCKRRGGQCVQMPKSMSIKAAKLWARAVKLKLV